MANGNAQRMWLHDEGKTTKVLPYTTLDSILMRENGQTDISQFEDRKFEDDYNQLKIDINAREQSVDNTLNALSNSIDSINIIDQPATHTTDGLMSKEDKIKLDNIDSQSINVRIPPATESQLGGVIVGSGLNIDGNGVLNVNTQNKTLENLTDVEITDPSNTQVLAYNATSEKWYNATFSEVSDINDISNVNISEVAAGQVLKYISGDNGGYWTNGDISFTSATLNSFTDVTITSPAEGDCLVYDSTNRVWKNSQVANLPIASTSILGGVIVDGTTITIDENGVISSATQVLPLENLSDVDINNLADNQILKYDSISSKWVNTNNEVVTTLANLTDTTVTSPTHGEILKYNGTTNKWVNSGESEELNYNDTLEILGEPSIEPTQNIENYEKVLVYDSGSDTTYAPVSAAVDNLNVDVSFNQDISKFDQLMVIFSAVNDGNYTVSGRLAFFDVNLLLTSNKAYDHTDFSGRWFRFKVKDSTTFAYFSAAVNENLEGYRPRIYKIYGIKYNCLSSSQSSQNIENYSIIEKRIGTWIDGKPLYRKTYSANKDDFDEATWSTNDCKAYLDLGMSNIDKIWIDLGKSFIFLPDRLESPLSNPTQLWDSGGGIRCNIQQSSNRFDGRPFLYMLLLYGRGSITPNDAHPEFVFTINYTKTTD